MVFLSQNVYELYLLKLLYTNILLFGLSLEYISAKTIKLIINSI